jgi:hypothetical protein
MARWLDAYSHHEALERRAEGWQACMCSIQPDIQDVRPRLQAEGIVGTERAAAIHTRTGAPVSRGLVAASHARRR